MLVICILISLFIWILIKLSEEDSSAMRIPVSYHSSPPGKLLISKSHEHINVRISSKGFDMIDKKYFKRKEPVSIDLSGIQYRENMNYNAYILISEISRNIRRQLSDFEIEEIFPDTLYFDLQDLSRKKVPVRLNLDYALAPQFRLQDSISIHPDSIYIQGLEDDIEPVGYVETESKSISPLSESRQITLPLKLPVSKQPVTLSSETVNVNIDVEEYTEATVMVPVRVMDDGSNVRLKTFPGMIQVTYHIALKDFSRIDTSMFHFGVRFSDRTETSNTLPVRTISYPEYADIVRIQPQVVEYIIIK